MEAQAKYDALYEEYQEVMHAGAWRIAWGFFFVLVGLLPMMYAFIWAIGPKAWENTFFHAPKLMWLAPLLNFPLVVFLVFRLYKKNLELDAIKGNYLAELKELKSLIPESPKAIQEPENEVREFETDY